MRAIHLPSIIITKIKYFCKRCTLGYGHFSCRYRRGTDRNDGAEKSRKMIKIMFFGVQHLIISV